jgi:hypothetical protein
MPMGRLNRVAAALGVAVAGVVAVAAPAAAHPPSSLWCASGGNRYYCDVFPNAVTPYTIRWKVGGVAWPWLDDQYGTGLLGCSPYSTTLVEAIVTDPTGTTPTSWQMWCNPDEWP